MVRSSSAARWAFIDEYPLRAARASFLETVNQLLRCRQLLNKVIAAEHAPREIRMGVSLIEEYGGHSRRCSAELIQRPVGLHIPTEIRQLHGHQICRQ